MAIKEDKNCNKGDIAKETLKFQIVVEQAISDDGNTIISMWKSQSGRFEVDRYDKKASKRHGICNNKNESEAREAYETDCTQRNCSPYPEAEKYFKTKGRLK
jgi:hypothetical protein